MKPTHKPVTFTGPLTAAEKSDLVRCESVIKRGLNNFLEVGNALLEVSDKRLYRATHSTFREYVEDVWEISVRRAYELCEHAEVIAALPESVRNSAQLPPGQTHELAKAPPAERAAVLEQAAEETDGHVTAAKLNELVKRKKAPPADEPDWAKAASHQLTDEEKAAKRAEMHDQLFRTDLARIGADLKMMTEEFPEHAGDMIKFLAGWLARFRDIPGAVPAVIQRKGPARADNHTLWDQVEATGKAT